MLKHRIENINEEGESYGMDYPGEDSLGALMRALRLLEEFPNDSIVITLVAD